jgi:hypothetical protein
MLVLGATPLQNWTNRNGEFSNNPEQPLLIEGEAV